MENEKTLYLVGGGILVVAVLFLMTRKSGGSSFSVSPSGTTSANIIAANAAANDTAAKVTLGLAGNATDIEKTRLGYKTAIAAQTTAAGQQIAQNAANYNMAQLEGQFASQQAQDRFAAAHADLLASDQTQLSLAQINTAAQTQQVKYGADLQHAISDNQTTQSRINKGSSFGNFLQAAIGGVSAYYSGGASRVLSPAQVVPQTPAPPPAYPILSPAPGAWA